MSQEPRYPADAVPGQAAKPAVAHGAAPSPTPATPAVEQASAASDAPATAATAPEEDRAKSRRWQAGVAIGVGSAAVAAALLYANRPSGNRPKRY